MISSDGGPTPTHAWSNITPAVAGYTHGSARHSLRPRSTRGVCQSLTTASD